MKNLLFITMVVLLGGFLLPGQVAAAPDLIVSNLQWAPVSPSDGETITIDATIRNVGTTEVTTDFYVPFFVNDVYIGQVKVTQNLGPGESTNPSTVMHTYTVTPFDNDIRAKADWRQYSYGTPTFTSDVTESNEDNNVKEDSFYVAPSDLIVSALTWTPLHPAEGDTVTFDATIKNNGQGETVRDFYVPFFVDDVYIGQVKVTQNLDAGESTNLHTVQYTWTMTPFEHEVKVKADWRQYSYGTPTFTSDVIESNELNNELTKSLSDDDPEPTKDQLVDDMMADMTVTNSELIQAVMWWFNSEVSDNKLIQCVMMWFG